MVQQTIDSNFSEYGLPNSETGLPNHDKQLPLPANTKKIALRDLQNENSITSPKSMASTLFSKESGLKNEAFKVSGIKRPAPECLSGTPQQQSVTSNAANGHLVYVRRRPEIESAKNNSLDNTSSNTNCSQARKPDNQDEGTEQKSQAKGSKICTPEVAPIPGASLMCLASGIPSVPPSLGKSNKIIQPADSDYLHASSAIPPLDNLKRTNEQHWEERFCRLQDFLKMLDQSNQEDYVQMLHPLSSVELSKHAVELEKRSIQLSLEEAKEIQRVRQLDVLGKYSTNHRAPAAQQVQ